jgi:hypothetical protein
VGGSKKSLGCKLIPHAFKPLKCISSYNYTGVLRLVHPSRFNQQKSIHPNIQKPRSRPWTSGDSFTAWKLDRSSYFCFSSFLLIWQIGNGTFWKGIRYSVFIMLLYSVYSKGRIKSRDHKHYFDWLTSLISKTWKTGNVIQVAKEALLEFTDTIASGTIMQQVLTFSTGL